MELVLASRSPRRVELLKRIREEFTVDPADADETLPAGLPPAGAVEYLARLKAAQVARRHPGALVIGADTVVALGDAILGKPRDAAHAAQMLRLLAGQTHTVYTGVALLPPAGEAQVFHQQTHVTFYPLSEREIARYIETGEPFDKAGAYGIQQKGALLVRGIEGDYFNVCGFPVALVSRRLAPLLAPAAG